MPSDGLTIQSRGPLAAGARHRDGRVAVKVHECATAHGSEIKDRGRMSSELAARFSAAIRT